MAKKKPQQDDKAGSSEGAEESPGLLQRIHWPLVGGVLAICLLATLCRTVPTWDHVYDVPEEVRFFGTDAYYHLRHTRALTKSFPTVKRYDHATYYPHGHHTDIPGLYDVFLAGVALVVGFGSPSEALIANLLAWSTVFFGILGFLLLFLLVRRMWGTATGVVAMLLLLAFPGSYLNRTLLGFADHHAVEVLLALWAGYGLFGLLRREPSDDALPTWRPAFKASLPLALFQFTWLGAPVYLLFFGLGIFLMAMIELARGDDIRHTARQTSRYGSGLLVWLLVGLIWQSLVMDPKLYPLILAGGFALAALLPGALWLLQRFHKRGNGTWLAAGSIALVAAGMWVAFTQVPQGERFAGKLFGKRTFLVREHLTGFSWTNLWRLHGPVAFVALAMIPLMLWQGWKSRERTPRARLPILLMALFLSGLWIQTQDFGYMLGPLLALLAAPVLVRAYGLLGRSKPFRYGSMGAFAIVLLLSVPGAFRLQTPWPSEQTMQVLLMMNDGWAQALEWMRTETPEPSVGIDDDVGEFDNFRYPDDTYGVISAWDFGSIIAALGKRPVAWSQGASKRTARWLLSPTEQEAWRKYAVGFEEGERFRYVMIDARTMGEFFRSKIILSEREGPSQEKIGSFRVGSRTMPLYSFGPLFDESIAHRLYMEDGDELSHFRMVYRSPHQSYLAYNTRLVRQGGSSLGINLSRVTIALDTEEQLAKWSKLAGERVSADKEVGYLHQGHIMPTVKVFERVKGARLQGRTEPGQLVQARLKLKSTTTDELLDYRRSTVADDEGRFELRLPYPTGQAEHSAIYAPYPYEVRLLPKPEPAMELAATKAFLTSAHGAVLPGSTAAQLSAGVLQTSQRSFYRRSPVGRVNITEEQVQQGEVVPLGPPLRPRIFEQGR